MGFEAASRSLCDFEALGHVLLKLIHGCCNGRRRLVGLNAVPGIPEATYGCAEITPSIHSL